MTSHADPSAGRTRAATPRYWAPAASESALSAFVPFSSLVTDRIAITRSGDYVSTWRLGGTAAECADERQIGEAHEAICNFLAVIGGGQFAVWRHRTQRRLHDRLERVPTAGFAQRFDDDYAAHLSRRPFLSNEHYLSLVYRPYAGTHQALRDPARSVEQVRQHQEECIGLMQERAQLLGRMLRDLGPEPLGSYLRGGRRFSALAEFYGYLVNGVWSPVREDCAPMHRTLPRARLSFGGGALELRAGESARYAVLYDIKEYADEVEPGSLNALLYEDIEYIETQGFAAIPRTQALKDLKLQRNQLLSAADVVASQIEAMDEAMDAVGDGHLVLGQYHYSLAVFGASLPEAQRAGARAAGAIAEQSGISLVPCDLVADAAWFAQWPGNFRWRTRSAKLTSRAYAALTAAHTFSRGKRDGNPWGPALLLLRTPSGQPFYLNLHASPDDEDSQDRKLPGNTLIVGATGVGKTTLELALVAAMWRYQPSPTVVLFDKDRGCEIFVRAMGGRYFTLQAGTPTGVNPLQREPSPSRLQFWAAWVEQCIHDPALPLLPDDHKAIHEAVHTVARMPREHRRLSTLRQLLPRGKSNSLYDRLGRWCEGGALGWVFDEADDSIALDGAPIVGFDYTDFLDHATARPPLLMALLDTMGELIDGRRFVYVMAEAWKALDDSYFADFIRDKQKTIRKQNGLGIFDIQSPSDVLSHPIGRTMVEQSPTMLLLPNPAARREEYVDGLGLTEAEFEIVRSLKSFGSHRFLAKQGHQSAICDFDLSGLDDALTVLSGSTDNVELLDALRDQLGDNAPGLIEALKQQVARRRPTTQEKTT